MRKLWIVLAVVFAASLLTAAGVDAKCRAKHKVRHHVMCVKVMKHKATTAKCPTKRMAKPARVAKGPKCPIRHKRHARPARVARGPMVTCPSPVVNVPQQAAPVVNVAPGPAPVVNIPALPPTVGITVDNCMIYIVRENQLMVLDKNTFEVKKTVPLQ